MGWDLRRGLHLKDFEADGVVAARALAGGCGVECEECLRVEVHAEVGDIDVVFFE